MLNILSGAGRVISVLLWAVCGIAASFWWLPKYLNAQHPLYWQDGVVYLTMLWIWVFNQWPRVGTRRFFKENRFLKTEFGLLIIISSLFTLGLAI